MAEVDDLMAEVGENSAKGGRCRGRHHFESAEKEEENVLLDQTIDKIRQLYGYKAIVRGYSKEKGATAIDRAGLVGGHHG